MPNNFFIKQLIWSCMEFSLIVYFSDLYGTHSNFGYIITFTQYKLILHPRLDS